MAKRRRSSSSLPAASGSGQIKKTRQRSVHRASNPVPTDCKAANENVEVRECATTADENLAGINFTRATAKKTKPSVNKDNNDVSEATPSEVPGGSLEAPDSLVAADSLKAADSLEGPGNAEVASGNPEASVTTAATEEPQDGALMDARQKFFSTVAFEDLDISEKIKQGLAEMGMKNLTEIQAKCVPVLLEGRDVLGHAQTGSGKTLAFLIPAMDLMYKVKLQAMNGTGCLVISPTRELALQIYDVACELGKFLPQTHGLIMGGANRKQEADKLSKGVNLLIATPGRLLDHLNTTKGFNYGNLLMLVIDEADRILEIGFEEDMTSILKLLPRRRQTALFSATQTTKVADLARLSLQRPILLEVKAPTATVEGLEQGYVICPAADRFKLLFTFLRKNMGKKVMVFFSSCMSTKFHYELFNYIDLPTSCIHGKKKQSARISTYYEFCQAKNGILLCTDVAARGLDIPKVDWIVQYDPPDDPKEYIHRVGRTARGAQGRGKALLFLMPEEAAFLHFLKQANVPLTEYKFSSNKIANIQEQLEKLIEKNYHLHRSSRDGYRSYIHAYVSHALKEAFNVHKLDLQQVSRSFGFANPPRIDLNLRPTSIKSRRVQQKGLFKKSGKKFSASNPTGCRDAGDKRQFCR